MTHTIASELCRRLPAFRGHVLVFVVVTCLLRKTRLFHATGKVRVGTGSDADLHNLHFFAERNDNFVFCLDFILS